MSKVDKRKNAIGVFDSGLGGLTVVKALQKSLPHEDIVYFGDTARVPYGTKSRQAIIQFSKENTDILLKHRVKMVVIACNSSTGFAITTLRGMHSVPIIGVIEPGVKCALKRTRRNRVGVIATPATIRSNRYQTILKRYRKNVKVFNQACPLFVPLVEQGWLSGAVTLNVAREYLRGLKKAKVDTLILGCTHYPLLRKTIQRVMGPGVELIDSAEAVAADVKETLQRMNLNHLGKRKARYMYLISDQPQDFKRIAQKFLGRPLSVVKKVSL